MLALVKKPRIELSIHGEHASELVEWIRKKYDLDILSEDEATDEQFVSIESTEYWKEMEKNRIGTLLAGARLKAGLTQAQLAEKLKIRQNMISDYERGRRAYSDAMARRLAKVLKVKEERLRYGRGQGEGRV
jgi:ribosome-binding protein aMBF1 (putative translation factor)